MNPSSSSHFGPGPCRFHSRRDPVLPFRPEDKNIAARGIPDQLPRDHRKKTARATPRPSTRRESRSWRRRSAANTMQRLRIRFCRNAHKRARGLYLNHPLRRRSAILRFCRLWRCSAANCSHPLSWSERTSAYLPSSLSRSRACLRQQCGRPPLTPCRRATAEMFAPGAKLSVTIRARSSSLQRRRRLVPRINSIRRQPRSRSANMPHPSNW